MLRSFDCVGVGLATLDYLALLMEFPRPGRKLEAVDSAIDGGGPVATALAAMAKLGNECAFVGKIGDDMAGKLVIQAFRKAGVNTEGIVTSPAQRTPSATVLVEQNSGRRTVLLSRNKSCSLKADELDADFLRRSKSLHLDGRDLAAAKRAARIARESGQLVFLDVGSIRNPVESLFPLVDHLVVSDDYALRFTGRRVVEKAAAELFQPTMNSLVVTMGIAGAIGYDGSKFVRQRAFQVRVRDTTGAGDAYHGAYIHKCLAGGSLAECMRFAAAVAALNCRQLGGRRSLPTSSEVAKLLDKGKLL